MRPLGLHLPSLRGRAWADRGPLLLMVAVVALITLIASAVPVLMPRVGTDAARDAVARGGSRADLVVDAPFEPAEVTWEGGRRRPLANSDQPLQQAEIVLGPDLAPVTLEPRAVVTSSELTMHGFGPGRMLFFGHLSEPEGEPEVVWTQGSAPIGAESDGFVLRQNQVGTVRVGLSEASARELKVEPGESFQVTDRTGRVVDVRVDGVFRALDEKDPAWSAAPRLLQPVATSTGTGERVELEALLTQESLPDARLALSDQDLRRTVVFPLDQEQLTWSNTQTLAAAVARQKTGFNPITIGWEANYRFRSGLDRVLDTVHDQGLAALEQARVLLIGVVATATAILLLTGDLLARRRRAVLANARRRGASLRGIGAELALESFTVTALGVAIGLLASVQLVEGHTWTWILPTIAVAVIGPPLLSLREVSRLTGTRRSPANRSARGIQARTAMLRRIAVEAAIVLAAAGAFTALRQRGLVGSTPEDNGGGLLNAVAPALGAIVAALIVVRLMPPLLRLALKAAARTRGSLPLLAAARAIATAARPLPLTVLVLACAMLTFSLSLVATTRFGQEEGTLRSVGADARLDLPASSSVSPVAEQIAARDGVEQAVSALVTDSVKVSTIETWSSLSLIAVDPKAFQELVDAPEMSELKAGDGSSVPALLAVADDRLRSGKPMMLAANGARIPLTDVGTAPAVTAQGEDLVIVDLAAYTAAMAKEDVEIYPNTIWVNGPGARSAMTEVAGNRGEITTRTELLSARRQAPLNTGIIDLAHACAAVLVLLGVLGVALATAITAPERSQTHSRLGTLGFRRRESRRMAFGEALPPVLLGAFGGVLAGIVLARTSFGYLALRLLTGQSDEPTLVVSWLSLGGVAILVLAVAITVWAESARRRHVRLGDALRVGDLG